MATGRYEIQTLWSFPGKSPRWYVGPLVNFPKTNCINLAARMASDHSNPEMLAHRVVADDGSVVATFPITAEPIHIAYDLALNDPS